MKTFKLFTIACLFFATNVHAEVAITDAWVRANAPGQKVGAAYMTLTSPQDSTFVYAETAVAGKVQIHSMTMNNGMMKMRSVEELPLKASKAEKLSPGGLHLMLFDLKNQLKVGEKVLMTLCFKDKAGNITHQDVTFPIKDNN
jgi:periplasmic copper chaperone A